MQCIDAIRKGKRERERTYSPTYQMTHSVNQQVAKCRHRTAEWNRKIAKIRSLSRLTDNNSNKIRN